MLLVFKVGPPTRRMIACAIIRRPPPRRGEVKTISAPEVRSAHVFRFLTVSKLFPDSRAVDHGHGAVTFGPFTLHFDLTDILLGAELRPPVLLRLLGAIHVDLYQILALRQRRLALVPGLGAIGAGCREQRER